MAQLSSQAAVKENFTLDRSMLGLASGLIADSDADVKQAVNKLDGVSVHMLRFGADGVADPAEVAAVREAYHLRGWKHLVTASNSGGPLRNGTTDVWLVMDGTNLPHRLETWGGTFNATEIEYTHSNTEGDPWVRPLPRFCKPLSPSDFEASADRH